jgi:hypothetical protein
MGPGIMGNRGENPGPGMPGNRGPSGAGIPGNRGPSGACIPGKPGPSGAPKFVRGWGANPPCGGNGSRPGANGWRIGPWDRSRIGPCHGDPCDGPCHGDPCDGGRRMPRLGSCANWPNGM